MNAIEMLQSMVEFYTARFGRPPHEVTLGRAVYEELAREGHIQRGPSWQRSSDRVLGMRIDVDIRDDYKTGIEDYRRYAAPTNYRFLK